MAQFPAPAKGIAITHFIVSRDVERSRRFYTEVLGGKAVLEGELSIVALANGWVTIGAGSGPAADKPAVTLEPPSDPAHVSSFANIRAPRRCPELGHIARAGEASARPLAGRWESESYDEP